MSREISIAKRNMDLLSYLPPVMGEVRENQALAEIENPKIEKLWEDIEGVLKDQFVLDASNHGIKRWEGMLGISPKGTESLETRRLRVLSRLNEVLPYTYRRLLAWLMEVCQGEEFRMELLPEIYQLTLRLGFWDTQLLAQRQIAGRRRRLLPEAKVMTTQRQIAGRRRRLLSEAKVMTLVYQEVRKMIPANLVLQLLTAFDTKENANAYAGVHSQIAMYAHIDPYQAGSHEGEGIVLVGVVSKVGVWISKGNKGGEENG